jgi:eukaryotic-like serine/threonine-protein kinase
VESSHTLVQGTRPAQEPPRRRVTREGEQALPEGLVLDRYRLLERLGAGGFGVVWRAHDELLRREVAVKRVLLGGVGGPIDGERAGREALAAARLTHPAIVALYEACPVDDAFYLISELVDGHTLAQLIDEDALEDEEILEIGLALAGALSHAHARGVIHRDIKPQNVLVPHPAEDDDAPRELAAAKLTDFGGASLMGEEALTRTGDVLGTLAYMAPEQSEGHEVTEQADLYSLALVLYEAFSGVNPVRGATPAATVRRIGRRLPALERERRDLPSQLTRALDRALAPNPRERGSLEDLRLVFVESAQRGLGRSRWSPRSRRVSRPPAQDPDTHERATPVPRAAPAPGAAPAARVPIVRAPAPGAPHELLDEQPGEVREPGRTLWRISLPRAVWLAVALAVVVWQLALGRSGVALLTFAALLPMVALPADGGSRRVGAGWLMCVMAPVLGLAGLAGAFPVIAGQASRWRDRAWRAALGYWWLALAGALFDRRLWLIQPSRLPARSAWEGSLSITAMHVIVPLLVLGTLLGALLWAVGAAVLPWIVRGRSAAVDLLAVTIWSVALVAAAPALDAGLGAHASHPSPRGAILGAVLGAVLAMVTRALRGPV